MTGSIKLLTAAAFVAAIGAFAPAQAQTMMQQCGQQYQAAKAGGTLAGMSWKQFRTDCAAKLKAQGASAPAPAATAPTAAPVAATATNPLKPEPAGASAPAATVAAPGKAAPAATGGRAAMLSRERQCGAEWKAQKASLVAQTPGLTWPKYWSQCNTRLKAAGQ